MYGSGSSVKAPFKENSTASDYETLENGGVSDDSTTVTSSTGD